MTDTTDTPDELETAKRKLRDRLPSKSTMKKVGIYTLAGGASLFLLDDRIKRVSRRDNADIKTIEDVVPLEYNPDKNDD